MSSARGGQQPPPKCMFFTCSQCRCAPTLAVQAWSNSAVCSARAWPANIGAHLLDQAWREPYF
eukprot:1147687-Pelagomonas_calceolata.AAC.6